MARKKQKRPRLKWIIVLGIVLIFFVGFGVLNNSTPQPQQSLVNYSTYQDPTYGFSIQYPQAWKIRNDTQVFENGDAIAFGISGPTQKENTELTDGAQIAISKPFSVDRDLATWVREYYGNKSEFSQDTLSGHTYQTVYACGLGCMTYFYTEINGKVRGVAMFAQGPDKNKAAYENAGLHMLKSLKFDNAENNAISKEQAIAKIRALPEVIDYLKRVPNGLIAVNGEENDSYSVQAYEIINGHTATFNWYKVDKITGTVEKQF